MSLLNPNLACFGLNIAMWGLMYVGLGHNEPSTHKKMNGKWLGNIFLLGFISLTNHG
jgi:hypothetical protein